jgi:predicted phage terminase large subunit-like protein
LVTFARTVEIPGVPQNYDDEGLIPKVETGLARHHILMLEVAQKLVEDKLITPDGRTCKRVMFFLPPGSAKSTYLSVVFPAWVMGKYPDTPMLLTGYGDTIAKKHGRRARQVCLSAEYQAIFETRINPNTTAADNWALENGSSYIASGLQSGLTGHRAAGLIIDDPVKGRGEAESSTVQEATWAAYKDDARTRKVPTAFEIIVSTRWHELDLAGRILPERWTGESGFIECRDGNVWYIVCLQAMVEHEGDPLGRGIGEYLWTEWFNEAGDPEAYWKPFKLDSRSWGSLYQQVPTPPEGDFFKASWVQYYEQAPKHLKTYISADYAVTAGSEGSDPDYSVIGVWGVDPDRRIYFLDGWHGRTDASVWIDTLLDLVQRWEPLAHVAGKGQIRRGVEPFLKERMIRRGIFVRLEFLEETYAKEINARSFQAMMASGQVYWPRTDLAAWIIRQLTGFGTLPHDDGVDACSMLGRYLHRLWSPREPQERIAPAVIQGGMVTAKGLGAKLLKQR